MSRLVHSPYTQHTVVPLPLALQVFASVCLRHVLKQKLLKSIDLVSLCAQELVLLFSKSSDVRSQACHAAAQAVGKGMGHINPHLHNRIFIS